MGAWVRLIFLSIIWGSSFILMKKGLFSADGTTLYSGMQVATIRLFTAFIVLMPIGLYQWRKTSKKDLGWIIFAGILGNGIPAFLFAFAQTRIESSLTGILNSLTPFFTLLLGWFLFRIAVGKRAIIGVVLGLVGAIYLIAMRPGNTSGDLWYASLIVVATMCYGANVNLIKSRLPHLSSLQITSISFLLTGSLSFFYLLFSGTFSVALQSEAFRYGFGYISILGIVGTALALLVFNDLIKVTTAVFASSVTYLIPVVAILWGLTDGEQMLWTQWLATALILSGIKIIRS